LIDKEEDLMGLTKKLCECFEKHFPGLNVYAVNDVEGEDHVYARDENRQPMFDMLVSNSRKFVFLWYYIHPRKGLKMVNEMKILTLTFNKDFAVKFPNVPVKKAGWPSILRYGKKPAGVALEKFVVKAGNPQLDEKIYTENNLNTYRSYDWFKVPNALNLIKDKAMSMEKEFLKKRNKTEKLGNIRGRVLYAGCAYHHAYPKLGFGMRDIDVETFFSPEWFTNTRCALTRPCEIEEFGRPEYFANKTRWLDLMWNSFHTETGDFKKDVITYMNEMRYKSDRWSTISQRPIIDLETKETFYTPNWIKKLGNSIYGSDFREQ